MPDAPKTPTMRQKILLAAVSLPAAGFPVDDLVVRAWERYPETFSLAGHAYPDSNRVVAKLCGIYGLMGLGWIERTLAKRYRVTDHGRKTAKAIVDGNTPLPELRAFVPVDATKRRTKTGWSKKPPERRVKVAVTDGDANAVNALAKSAAWAKFTRGSPLTLADANAFWSKRQPADVDALLTRVVEGLNDACDSRFPSLSTCYGLLNMNRILRERFAR